MQQQLELQANLDTQQLQYQEKINIMQEKLGIKDIELSESQDRVHQKQGEIQLLQERLESRPWVLEKEEVDLTNEIIGGGAYGEVRVAIFRGTRVAAKCLHQLIVSDYNRGVFYQRDGDILQNTSPQHCAVCWSH